MKRLAEMADWQRNLWACMIVQVISLLAFNAGAVLIPYYFQELGITDVKQVGYWTGAYQSVGAITFAVLTPVWGAISDRFGRKPNLLRATIGTAVLLACTGLVKTPLQLVILRAIQGVFTGTPAASTALVAAGTPKRQLAFALGLLQTGFFIGMSMGPTLGGYVGDTLGFRPTFYIAGSMVLLSLYIVARFVREPEQSDAARAQVRSENALKTFVSLLRNPAYTVLIGLTLLINSTGSLLNPVMPLFIQQLVGPGRPPASVAGTVSGAGALAAAISSVVVGKLSERIGHRRAVLICAIGVGALFVPQGLAPTATFLGVFVALQGLFRGGIGPNMSAMVVEHIPKSQTGSGLGLNNSAGSVGFAVGPMVGAAIMAGTSMRTVFFFAASLYVLVVIAVAILARRPESHAEFDGPAQAA